MLVNRGTGTVSRTLRTVKLERERECLHVDRRGGLHQSGDEHDLASGNAERHSEREPRGDRNPDREIVFTGKRIEQGNAARGADNVEDKMSEHAEPDVAEGEVNTSGNAIPYREREDYGPFLMIPRTRYR